MRRAIEKYDVNVIGLTLSRNQAAHVQKAFDVMDTARSRRVLLHGWEQFDEPVDRIVSIGAFEHFGYDRYDDFFGRAYSILPDDGVMQLHTITMLTGPQIVERGLPLSEEQTSFNEFIGCTEPRYGLQENCRRKELGPHQRLVRATAPRRDGGCLPSRSDYWRGASTSDRYSPLRRRTDGRRCVECTSSRPVCGGRTVPRYRGGVRARYR